MCPMCQESPDTLTHLVLVLCQHTDIQHARCERYKELTHLAELMTFENAEVSGNIPFYFTKTLTVACSTRLMPNTTYCSHYVN